MKRPPLIYDKRLRPYVRAKEDVGLAVFYLCEALRCAHELSAAHGFHWTIAERYADFATLNFKAWIDGCENLELGE